MKNKRSHSKKSRFAFFGLLSAAALIIGLLILIVDQASKYWVQGNIPRMSHETQWYPYGGIGVFEDFFGIEFSLVHAVNRGSAWGLFAEYQHILLICRILFVALILVYLFWYNKSPKWTMPLTLIAAGAIGNIVDYFFYGHVVDMFHFVFWRYDYPVFNVADSAIFIGVWWMIFLNFFDKKLNLFSKA